MDGDWPDEVEECLLERTDGTEWVVSEMTVRGPEVRVTARRRDGPGGRGRDRMSDEPLDRGDVIRWLDEGGSVIWTMRHLGLGRESPASEGADGVLELGRDAGDGAREGRPEPADESGEEPSLPLARRRSGTSL